MAMRYTQPQGGLLRIDRKNQIAASSTVILNPAAGAKNLVNGIAFANPIAAKAGVAGLGYTAAVASPFNVAVSVTAYPYAMYFVQTRNGAGNWSGLSSTANGAYYSFVRGDTGATDGWTASDSTSGEDTLLGSPAPSSASHCYMLVARSATDRVLVVDGIIVGTSTASRLVSFDRFNIGGLERTGGGFLSNTANQVALAGLSQGLAITNEQAIAFTRNPWQLFAPTQRSIWVPVAGGTATVIPIGVSATGSVGAPAATGAALATPAGVSTAASVGAPTATGGTSIPATVTPPGVSATASVGTPSATGAAKATPAGISASAAVGTPVAFGGTSIPATALPAGVAALSYVGTPIATAGASGAATVQPSGVQALSYTGTVIATGAVRAFPAGASAVGAIGLPIAYAGVFEAYIPGAMAGRRMAADSRRPARIQTGSRPAR